MNMVTVYEFMIRDPESGEFVRAPRKATREAIDILRGRVIEDTADRVPESRLDENGILTAPSDFPQQGRLGPTPRSPL